MTVRWKPLLVLSGVFATIAIVGVVAIALTLMPRGASDILPKARAEQAAKHYEKAEIYYKQAKQLDGKNPAIHLEMAKLYAEWGAHAPAEKQAALRALRLASLADAAKHGETLKEPRRELLAAAMAQDELPESLSWAKKVLALEPENVDAHYVMAAGSLDDQSGAAPEKFIAAVPEAKRHLKSLENAKASEVRITWLKARIAQVSGDAPALEPLLAHSRTLSLPADADPVDRSALIRLQVLDVEKTSVPDRLAERVKRLQAEAHAMVSGPGVAPNRVMRLNLLLGQTQRSLAQTAAHVDARSKPAIEALVDAIDKDIETIFQQALAALSKTDMHVYLTYADHLRYRNKRARCLEVVDQALKSPLAGLATSTEALMGLHAVAVEAALTDGKDETRFEKAEPHIKALISSNLPRSQGFGHLFQGAIELEQSGVVGAPTSAKGPGAATTAVQPKLRTSALNHLKLAAAQLPDVVEAQARYGVALILSQEMSLGRQYLQSAMRRGQTEPQYQVWAAWSVVQAGYPEEAEPIVNHLLAEYSQGRVPPELEGTLHLLEGEIHQARRTPADLRKALSEYEHSYSGKFAPAGVQLRMAQIDVQLGQGEHALRRIEELRARGEGGTAAEHLAVLTLQEMGKPEKARETLVAARARYPESEELVSLEAAYLVKENKPEDADKVLSEFLTRNPNNLGVTILRAQVLSDLLDKPDDAHKLLSGISDRSDNSAPLVQLALLDLKKKDYDAVTATITKIRARWKEAASADLLDAQLSLVQGNLTEAVDHFDAALKKDPGNKLVQFWKAQIDTRLGDSTEAAQAFENLAKEGSTKRLDSGLSLAAAARSALANLALQNNDIDGAIRRFESLRSGGSLSGLERGDRWQLVAAYAAKGQWPAARKDIASLLNDPKIPPSIDERVRAANYYRQNKEDDAAIAQLDYVIKTKPAHTSAVVSRAYMLWEAKKTSEASALIRKAIAQPGGQKPPAVFYLMLAALENDTPPAADSTQRAMTALDQGLEAQPQAPDLVQAKYKLLSITEGPKAAMAYVESEAMGDSKGNMLRMLAEVYREQKDYSRAEKVLRDLVKANPKEPGLALALVRVVSTQAVGAGEINDRDRERSLNEKAASLIKEFRGKFPRSIVFLQEDCDLAFRRGDTMRATAITNEIDQLAKNSPVGPLLRARLFAAQGRTRDVAECYNEALRRNPAQPDVRLLLGQTNLKLGESDEAIRQAKLVLETERDRGEALLLEAQALAQPAGSASQTKARRTQAVDLLNAALKRYPKFTAAYHQVAAIHLMSNQRDEAVATLRTGLAAAPEDSVALAQLVELLAGPVPPDGKPAADQLAAAQKLAGEIGDRDKSGALLLALAVGFHKAGQLDLASDWAQKAAKRLDAPIVHLNYGDILLSIAETTRGEAALSAFRRAVEQYDQVLKTQANSVEAINNKAWILYRYLGESQKALEIAQGLLSRVDPSTLPGEFFDTIGAIQESLGKTREAEDSYTKGLRKAPDNPVLNYHMGKLILADSRRTTKARSYLEQARAGRNRLTPSMAAEVDSLFEKIRDN